ncbi:avidin-related protein 3-like [Pelodytes ibericus]
MRAAGEVQVIVLFLFVMGANCHDMQHKEHCNISGVWINTLGSSLSLLVNGAQLSGTLKSAVESSPGAAGEQMTGKVVGVLGDGVPPTFAMSVSWSGGSVSTWVGQCFQERSRTVLKTTWLLRSKVATEDQNWMATRIGEDSFHLQKKSDTD